MATPGWGQDTSSLGPTLMRRGGASDTPLPQVLSSVATYSLEGEEDILDVGSGSSADEVTNWFSRLASIDLCSREQN